jgi:hypothetical protein
VIEPITAAYWIPAFAGMTVDMLRRYPTVIASLAKQSISRLGDRWIASLRFAMTLMDRTKPLFSIRMSDVTTTTSVNTVVTSFLYPPPTISPVSRA